MKQGKLQHIGYSEYIPSHVGVERSHDESGHSDPIQMYLNDVFTVTVNLAGLPGISVPAGMSASGLPLGLQLIGKPWEEGDLLNIAQSLEASAGFVSKPGKWW